MPFAAFCSHAITCDDSKEHSRDDEVMRAKAYQGESGDDGKGVCTCQGGGGQVCSGCWTTAQQRYLLTAAARGKLGEGASGGEGGGDAGG